MNEEKKILHLTLKKEWFARIASGEKVEEYREWKPYWATRLAGSMSGAMAVYHGDDDRWNKYDIVRFKNGYHKKAPQLDVECAGIYLGKGRPEWGGTDKCIIIKLVKYFQLKTISNERRG